VVAGLDRHLNPDMGPPVEAGADRQHDALLGRRLVAARRHDEAGAAHTVGVELLDHDLIEERSQLVADRLGGVWPLGSAHTPKSC
jgi:hypothetical protein